MDWSNAEGAGGYDRKHRATEPEEVRTGHHNKHTL